MSLMYTPYLRFGQWLSVSCKHVPHDQYYYFNTQVCWYMLICSEQVKKLSQIQAKGKKKVAEGTT